MVFITYLTALLLLAGLRSLSRAQNMVKIKPKPGATYQQANPQLRMTCVSCTVGYRNKYVPGSYTDPLARPWARIIVTDPNRKRVGADISSRDW